MWPQWSSWTPPVIDPDEPLVRVYLTRGELERLAHSYRTSSQRLEAVLKDRDRMSPLEKRARARLRKINARLGELKEIQ
jgi:hypothetical protein